jgi:hypothetical protein
MEYTIPIGSCSDFLLENPMHPFCSDSSYFLAQLSPLLTHAENRVHHLVLLEGGNWQLRTAILRAVASSFDFAYIPLGLNLSRALLSILPKERPLVFTDQLDGLIAAHPRHGIALDQIEILFSPELHTDSYRLLQSLSLYKLILVSWPGQYINSRLSYSKPGHPEYYSYSNPDVLVFSLQEIS